MIHWILDNIKNILETIVAFAATVGLFWKRIKKWYNHYRNGRDARWIALMEVQKLQNEKLDMVIKQLFPNGGSSVLDKVEKVLDAQEIMAARDIAKLDMDETPIIRANMNGECIWANTAYLKMSGFNSMEEAIGIGGLRSVHPDDAMRVRNGFIDAIKTNTQYFDSYRKINLITHEVFKVTATARVVENSKKVPVEIISIIKKDQ